MQVPAVPSGSSTAVSGCIRSSYVPAVFACEDALLTLRRWVQLNRRALGAAQQTDCAAVERKEGRDVKLEGGRTAIRVVREHGTGTCILLTVGVHTRT